MKQEILQGNIARTQQETHHSFPLALKISCNRFPSPTRKKNTFSLKHITFPIAGSVSAMSHPVPSSPVAIFYFSVTNFVL